MKLAGVWAALAAFGVMAVAACDNVDATQDVSVSEAGGFSEPERRLADGGEQGYCRSEVLRWRYDGATGALKLADSRLLLSCCGQRALHVQRIDSMIEVTETDEPDASSGRCDSVCAFDFAAAVAEVPGGKVYLRLLRDITDAQGSAELVWQGELDLSQASGAVVLDKIAAGDACSSAAP